MKKYTKLPWRIKFNGHIFAGSRLVAVCMGHSDSRDAAKALEENKANAEFIVAACNQHNSLRKALEKIRRLSHDDT